jgi:hypothetical protein
MASKIIDKVGFTCQNFDQWKASTVSGGDGDAYLDKPFYKFNMLF